MTTTDYTPPLSPYAADSPGPMAARIGHFILRYGLVVLLISVGALKFTVYEAEGIKPLVTNSPLMAWGYSAMGVYGFARLIGTFEIIAGLLIAVRPVSAWACVAGSAMTILMGLVTLSFVVTTPATWQKDYGFPFPSPMPGQFLLKDVLLLGVAVWSLGEAWTAAAARRTVVAVRGTTNTETYRA